MLDGLAVALPQCYDHSTLAKYTQMSQAPDIIAILEDNPARVEIMRRAVTVDLLVGPLLDDQPTDNHLLADELAKPYDRTVTVPCDFWI